MLSTWCKNNKRPECTKTEPGYEHYHSGEVLFILNLAQKCVLLDHSLSLSLHFSTAFFFPFVFSIRVAQTELWASLGTLKNDVKGKRHELELPSPGGRTGPLGVNTLWCHHDLDMLIDNTRLSKLKQTMLYIHQRSAFNNDFNKDFFRCGTDFAYVTYRKHWNIIAYRYNL